MDMLCHGESKKICCESVENVGPATKEPNSLNIRPSSDESIKTTDQTTQSTSTTTEEAKISLSTLITTKASTVKIGISEATYRNGEVKSANSTSKQSKPKAFSSKTTNFDDSRKPIYKPHEAGGYAVSKIKTVDKVAATQEDITKKEIVQQYLLDQIKQGWPYDEKFFRPGSKFTPI